MADDGELDPRLLARDTRGTPKPKACPPKCGIKSIPSSGIVKQIAGRGAQSGITCERMLHDGIVFNRLLFDSGHERSSMVDVILFLIHGEVEEITYSVLLPHLGVDPQHVPGIDSPGSSGTRHKSGTEQASTSGTKTSRFVQSSAHFWSHFPPFSIVAVRVGLARRASSVHCAWKAGG